VGLLFSGLYICGSRRFDCTLFFFSIRPQLAFSRFILVGKLHLTLPPRLFSHPFTVFRAGELSSVAPLDGAVDRRRNSCFSDMFGRQYCWYDVHAVGALAFGLRFFLWREFFVTKLGLCLFYTSPSVTTGALFLRVTILNESPALY